MRHFALLLSYVWGGVIFFWGGGQFSRISHYIIIYQEASCKLYIIVVYFNPKKKSFQIVSDPKYFVFLVNIVDFSFDIFAAFSEMLQTLDECSIRVMYSNSAMR